MENVTNIVKINGKFIGVKEKLNTFVVKKDFTVKNPKKAQLKITALGLYVAYINGERVGNDYFTPGFTVYNKFLQVQTYDVLSLLKNGENTIEIIVNHGWYAGRFGLENTREIFGKEASCLASLSINDETGAFEIVTDKSWLSTESYITFSGFYDGETQDYTKTLSTLTTYEVDVKQPLMVDQMCEFVRNQQEFKVEKVITTPNNELVYDFGQNIAGTVFVDCNEKKEIVLQFAEILDENGNFYLKNLRSATGTYKVKTNGKQKTDCLFTYYGFRYVKVVTKNVKPDEITAVARYSDLKQTGNIQVEHKKLNRFILNTLWSQRDNFVDIPTDCPQRDERLGWTGDINAFLTTASYNYDVRLFLKKWLACLRADQKEDGTLPVVTPDVLNGFKGVMSMWCDCSIMVPYKLYKHYGDISFLKDNYEMMKKYLLAKENHTENGMITKGFEYGDWLALDSEECVVNKVFGGTDLRYISNVFYYECLCLTSKIADIIGENNDKIKYKERADKLLEDIRNEYFTATNRLAVSTITAHVLALHFNICKENARERIAKELNEKVVNNNYHVTTGFIGTTYLLFALADNGYMETAIKVLLNEEFPGWIHEVNIGATTVWERWNSLKTDGSPNDEGMTSFNHYAYGSMVEFLYRRIAGIENVGTGFDNVVIMPHAHKNIGNVKAEYESVKGKISSSITFLNDSIVYEIVIPDGVNATLKIHEKQEIPLKSGYNKYVEKIN